MKIDHCEFPDDVLYDEDGLVWARVEASGDLVVGITSIQAAVAGRLSKIVAGSLGKTYARGESVATLESGRYFGPVRAPVSGVLRAANETALASPRLVTDSVYETGWIVRIRPTNLEAERTALQSAADAKETLARQIVALRVRCFAAFPDYEMFEIGLECSAVLAKLDELLLRVNVGEVIHLVTDDATAPIEMVRWSEQSGQPVIDERKEGNLFHFLVRKVK